MAASGGRRPSRCCTDRRAPSAATTAAACADVMCSGAGTTGAPRSASLARARSTDSGSGGSWTRYTARLRRRTSSAATSSLAMIISSSMSACARASPSQVARATRLPSMSKTSSRGSMVERPALEAPRPQLPRDAVGQGQLLAGHGMPRPSLEQGVGLAVRQPGAAADERAVEARTPRPQRLVEQDLDRDRAPVAALLEAAHPGRELVRQHRLDLPRHVHRQGSPAGIDVERTAQAHVERDVGDVDPAAKPVPVLAERDGVVEVARSGRIDRHDRQVAQVDAPGVEAVGLDRRRPRVLDRLVRAGAGHAPFDEQRPHDHVDVAGAAEAGDDTTTPALDPDGHELAGHRGHGPPPAERDRRARLEEALRHGEAAAARDLADDGEVLGRPLGPPAHRPSRARARATALRRAGTSGTTPRPWRS